jgi:filamentous hemagglutinin
MALSGDVNNSGTIMGRQLVDISAQNINNGGLVIPPKNHRREK